MILCVDRGALKKESPEVQKDIDIEDILNNHTKFFYNAEEAETENYAPLYFSVCVRSTYSNLVLERDDIGDLKKYYTNLRVEQPFNHKGYDLLMFLTSIGIMNNIFYAMGFDDLMMNHSQFQPIGLYNLGSPLIDPIIVTHVILSDEGAEEFSKFLMPNRRFVSISDMNTKGNLKAITNTLIEVKEEENNA